MTSEESMSNVSWPLPSSQSGASEELSVVLVSGCRKRFCVVNIVNELLVLCFLGGCVVVPLCVIFSVCE